MKFASLIPPGCVCDEIDADDRPCISCDAAAVLGTDDALVLDLLPGGEA